uniref:Uncharacterized protein n=1 Tax=Arundo donax TaxID=35708 RepID=A0A0A9BTG8_ARUDO
MGFSLLHIILRALWIST